MTKIRLGGIKIFEKHTCLTKSSTATQGVLSKICSNLANLQINITLLTHIADIGGDDCRISTCINEFAGKSASYVLMNDPDDQGHELHVLADVNILALFPHEQRFDVTGMLIRLMVQEFIYLFGFASSPSAICIIVPAPDATKLIDSLFRPFEFRSYKTPLDWHAAYKGQEQVLKEIVCSYQEKIIKVYNVVRQTNLDLWKMILPGTMLPKLGQALALLHDSGMRMPFLVAQPDAAANIYMAFCLESSLVDRANNIFNDLLPSQILTHQSEVSIFFLQGPHFGDRFGIVSALTGALRHADINPLALSCAVNSMSVVVPTSDLTRTVEALKGSFQIPEE